MALLASSKSSIKCRVFRFCGYKLQIGDLVNCSIGTLRAKVACRVSACLCTPQHHYGEKGKSQLTHIKHRRIWRPKFSLSVIPLKRRQTRANCAISSKSEEFVRVVASRTLIGRLSLI